VNAIACYCTGGCCRDLNTPGAPERSGVNGLCVECLEREEDAANNGEPTTSAPLAGELETQAGAELKRYVIPASVLAPHLGASSEYKVATELALCLARIACGVGKNEVNEDGRGEPLLREAGSGYVDRGPSVELLPDQVKALREIGRAIQAATDGAYQKGIAEGKSLLYGLASGRIRIDQLNDQEARLAQNRKLAPDPVDEEDDDA
jgi:hypothetical protein